MDQVRGSAVADTSMAREVLRLILWAILFGVVVMLTACGGGNEAPQTPPAPPSEVSATIGVAGGTLTGPDGVSVVIPPNALTQNTVIRIARSAAGAPAMPTENPPAGPVYEFTPHGLVFNAPVTIRMPVLANAVGSEVFMASPGEGWEVNGATVAGGVAEWQRNSFSWGLMGVACAIPNNNADPYPCTYPSGAAVASAVPTSALTRSAFGNTSSNAGSWIVNSAGIVSLTLNYRAAPDCGNARVKLLRWNPAVMPRVVQTLLDVPVSLTLSPVTLPPGTLASNSGGATFRGVGTTTVDVSANLTDAVNVFGFSFSCARPGRAASGGGDLITILGPMPALAPAITQQPVNQSVTAPATATFAAAASGTPTPTAQWQVSTNNGMTWSDINGATAASYTTLATVAGDNGKQFRAVFTNSAASAFTAAATLTVAPTPATPVFSTQPVNQTVTAGASATFTVAVTGTPAPSLQWQISADGGTTWTDIAGASGTSYTTPATVVGDSGKRYRANATNTAGNASSNAAVLTVNAVPIIPIAGALSAIGGHTCALKADQSVACWGLNSSYQLGDGTPLQKNFPTAVSGLSGIVAVSAGAEHSCALKADATVVCWGSNQYGQIGDGSGLTRSTPVTVPGLSGVTAISVGDRHSCALLADGTVVCWGKNDRGQLGDGTNVDKPTPVAVSGLSDIATISAGWDRTCAAGTNRRVECWGRNDSGQLGIDTQTDASTPRLVPGLTGVVAVRAGGNYHTCALKLTGGVSCWGDNGSGSLGLGFTSAPVTTPFDVVGLTDAVALTTGSGHSCAVKADSTVVCWGENSRGSIGDGSTTNRPTPVAVAGLTGVATVTAGGAYTCALKTDGSATCWGRNITGSLGDGTTVDKPTPTAVTGGAAFWK